MRLLTSIVTMSAITFGTALFLGTAALAGEPIQVGGKMTCKTPEQQRSGDQAAMPRGRVSVSTSQFAS
jgi:hypothetical protein